MLEVPAAKINLEFLLGNKVMVGAWRWLKRSTPVGSLGCLRTGCRASITTAN
jgi:hypothetical protein